MTQIIGKLMKKERPPTPVFLGFPSGSVGEESACNAGDRGLIPGLGRSPGEGNSYLLHPVFLPREFHEQRSLVDYSPSVHKSWTQLSD